jgi:CcmD family protein
MLSDVWRTPEGEDLQMDARNTLFMFYGFLAAWAIVLLYVVTLAQRGSRLKRELEDVKRLLSSRESSQQTKL